MPRGLRAGRRRPPAAGGRQRPGPSLHGAPGDPLILDLDSTHTETYGVAKDGAEVRNYLGKRGYHPLLGVEASTGQVINAQLRPGNASQAHGVAGFVADSLRRLRRLAGPATPLLIRADSGFYVRELFDHCVASDTRFSITVRQYPAIRKQIAAIGPDDWQPAAQTPTRRVDVAAVDFAVKGRTDHPRPPIPCRLIVRRVTTPAATGGTQPRPPPPRGPPPPPPRRHRSHHPGPQIRTRPQTLPLRIDDCQRRVAPTQRPRPQPLPLDQPADHPPPPPHQNPPPPL